MRRTGRPTGSRSRSIGMWREPCRCSCWTCALARFASSLRSGATRIRPGHPTAATWHSYPIVPGTGSCGSSIWTPAASGRSCSRVARGSRLGLPVSRRPPRRTPDPWREALEMKRLSLLALAVVAGAVTAAACGGPKPPPTAPTPQANPDSAAQAERARQDSIDAANRAAADAEAERVRRQREADSLAAARGATDEVRSMLAAMIHFDYDKAVLTGEDVGTLDQKVAILQANPALRIRISGHCDERGSDEYNLALGNRRATAAKQYLTSHGIDAGRIETVSYGEERPIDPGHNDVAWSRIRRDEFDILARVDALKQPWAAGRATHPRPPPPARGVPPA